MQARIQSVGRAASLVEAMESGEWVPLRVLAAHAGIARTTARNLLGALVDVGWVEHDPRHGAYRLGLPFLSFGKTVENRIDIAAAVRPHLIQLCARTRETVNLALPGPTDATIVDSFEGSQSLRVTSYTGTRAGYHSTACGRALLAWQSEAHRRSVYELAAFSAPTPHTVTDIEGIEKILAETRATGWALEVEENEVGSACVAAPILGSNGHAIASVSVAGPVARINAKTATHYADMLTDQLELIASEPDWPHAPDPATQAPSTVTRSAI